ncbi:MAG: hypothetical protein LBC74_14890, partial [Planctomycetaceae bacterium]|nr:hypothetical protein [Planctomycetaceae bacterium]
EFIKSFDSLLDAQLGAINKTKHAYLLYDYPVETMSVARRKMENKSFVERFELFINGLEIGHGFTDSLDADDVEKRMNRLGWRDDVLLAQLRAGKLPASGGFGIGIERLVQVSLGIQSTKDMVVPQVLEV